MRSMNAEVASAQYHTPVLNTAPTSSAESYTTEARICEVNI